MSKIRYCSLEIPLEELNGNLRCPSMLLSDSQHFDLHKINIRTSDTPESKIWTHLQDEINSLPKDSQYFIFSAPGALLTEDYDNTRLFRYLNISSQFDPEILLGGAGWFSAAIEIRNSLFWVEHFRGAHFVVIFRNMYDKILRTSFVDGDTIDLKLSYLAERKFLLFPFVASQSADALIEGEFHMHQGYFDSNAPVKVAVSSYAASTGRLAVLSKVRQFFITN